MEDSPVADKLDPGRAKHNSSYWLKFLLYLLFHRPRFQISI